MAIYPTYRPSLGEALVGAGRSFLAARQQRDDRQRAADLFEQNMVNLQRQRSIQNAQLAQQGIHLLAPGELLPTSVTQGAATDALSRAPSLFAPQVQPQVQPQAPTAPAMPLSQAAAGRSLIPGAPSSGTSAHPSAGSAAQSFEDNFAKLMLPQAPARPARFEFGNGYYVDRQPQFDAEDRAAAQKASDQFVPMLVSRYMQQQERDRKVGQYVAAGVTPERAALYVDNPTLAGNDPLLAKAATPQGPSFSFPVGVDASGKPAIFAGNTKTGQLLPTGIGAQQPGGAGAASIKTKVASNRQQISQIDNALALLNEHESAVGLNRNLPLIGNAVDQRLDPKGVAARAAIANIGSMVLNDRSGKAITAAEMPRLAPFIPGLSDKPETIRVKLGQLRGAIQELTNELEAGQSGTPDAGGNIDLSDEQLDALIKAGLSDEQIRRVRGTP